MLVDGAKFQVEVVSVSGSQYENGMKALSEMERTQQVEAIHSYNSMKSDLMDYLKTFAEEGKVLIAQFRIIELCVYRGPRLQRHPLGLTKLSL